MVQNELVLHSSGVKLLLASYQPKDIKYACDTDKFTTIINHLASSAQYTLVDIGANILPGIDDVLNLCNEAILVVEPMPNTINRTKVLLDHLADRGFSKSRILTLVLINRIRSDIQMSWTQVQEALGIPITSIITPAPELAYQACSTEYSHDPGTTGWNCRATICKDRHNYRSTRSSKIEQWISMRIYRQ